MLRKEEEKDVAVFISDDGHTTHHNVDNAESSQGCMLS
jgi:hypothetical protein